MIDRVRYDLRPVASGLGLDPKLYGTARRMAAVLLRSLPAEQGLDTFSSPNRDKLRISAVDGGPAHVELKLVDLDVEAIASMAEIAASMAAHFMPCDGGAAVPADPEALVLDVARRALGRIQVPGQSFYALACDCDVKVAEAEAKDELTTWA